MGNHSANAGSGAKSATRLAADGTFLRKRMIWRGSSMFLATLPFAAVAAFVGGPLALVNPPRSAAADIGNALLMILPLIIWGWVGMAVFCQVRRWRRNPAEAAFVAARKQADAEAVALRPRPQSSVSVGIDFFIGN